MHISPYRPPVWVPGMRRKFLIGFACEQCGGDMRIKNMAGRKKWMRCLACGNVQVDICDDGVRRVLVACVPAP
jgi:hypothetical protein